MVISQDSTHSTFADRCAVRPRLTSTAGHTNIPPMQVAADIHDWPSHFPIPETLFGRESELAALNSAIECLLAGESSLLLVSGPSGSGKSALLAAGLQRFGGGGQMHMAVASYEQTRQRAPHSALRQALTAVVRQILAAEDDAIDRWRQRLTASLGPNGQVMVDLLPEMIWLMGPQPALAELEPAAQRHRLLFTVRRFVAALSPPDHPLILVLDDLQWADEASLDLLATIASDPQPRALLLICTYRTDGTQGAGHGGHPWPDDLARLEDASIAAEHLELAPLPLKAVNDLVAALLHADPCHTMPLAERIQRFSLGNPLFTIEITRALLRAGAVTRAETDAEWRWDLVAVDRLDLSNDIVDLLASALSRLPDETQRLLTVAALLGRSFDLETLAAVQGVIEEDITLALWPAIQAGLLTSNEAPTTAASSHFIALSAATQVFHFRHDRIRQAAQASLEQNVRQAMHLRIGRTLLLLPGQFQQPRSSADNSANCVDIDAPTYARDRLFQAVHHLNAAAKLISSPDERRQLLDLNREAGRQARAETAYDAAWGLFQQALALLPVGDAAWSSDYDLTLALHIEAAEAAYLSAQHEAAESLASQAAARARTPAGRAKAYQVWVQAAIARNDLERAAELAAEAVIPLGMHLPQRSDPLSVLSGLARTRWTLRSRRVDELAHLPPVTDPALLAAGRIIASIGQALPWQGDPNRVALLTMEGIWHSLRYGMFPTSAVGFAGYGAMLCMLDGIPGAGDVDLAHRLGQLASRLAERPEMQPYRARVVVPVQYIINHRCVHHRDSLAPLLAGYQAGLESGDPEAAVLCALCYVSHAYQLGLPLGLLERQISDFAAVVAQFGQRATELALAINHQAVLNLLGRAADPLQLTGERCDEEAVRAELEQSHNRGALTAYLIVKAHLAYQFHDREAALDLADQVRPRLREIAGFFAYPRFLVLDALIRLAACDQADRPMRRRLLRQAQANLRRLHAWARQAPMNHAHDVHLLEAELARVQGRPDKAATHYAAAIRLCQEHGWASDEPLAAERAARFFLATGQIEQAQEHLRQARTGYLRWGALAVVQHFDQIYQAWLLRGPTEATEVATTRGYPTEGAAVVEPAAAPPELSALLAAAQPATDEEDLAALAQRMLVSAVEHSAAQRGVLLIPDPMEDPAGETVASLRVEAEYLACGERRALQAERLVEQGMEAAAAPRRVVNFVVHSRQSLALADVSQEVPFDADPAVLARQIRSLLCLPLRQPGRLLGVLYLENLPRPDLLSTEQVHLLALLATQAALSVQNARLWEERERSKQVDKGLVDKGKEGEEEMGSRAAAGRAQHGAQLEAAMEEGAGEVERWAAARMRQARLHGREGRWFEANAQVDEALALAHTADGVPAWRPIALGFAPELAVLPGGLQRCQVIAHEAARLAPANDDPWQLARLAQQASIAWLQGRTAQVLDFQRQALALAPPETTAWTSYLNDLLGLAISAHTARREYSHAQQALEMQAARLRHAGPGPLRSTRWFFRQARLDWLCGAATALHSIEQARQFVAAQTNHPWADVLLPTLAGMTALVEERFGLAEQRLRQASQCEAATPSASLVVRPSLLLAHALHAQGGFEAALDALTPVLEACYREHTPGLVAQEGAALIPLLRLAAQQGRSGPAAAHVLRLLGVGNVTRRLLVPETGIVLSPREVDVLELLAANASNRAIAERLDVDIATVKSHVTRVLAKLGVRTRHEAAERARALGLGNGW